MTKFVANWAAGSKWNCCAKHNDTPLFGGKITELKTAVKASVEAALDADTVDARATITELDGHGEPVKMIEARAHRLISGFVAWDKWEQFC